MNTSSSSSLGGDSRVLIIGIAGTNGSGKDSLGRILDQRANLAFISASDLLRAEADALGLPRSREVLRTIGVKWRREHGLGVLVDKALELYRMNYSDKAGLAIASLRNPGEVDRVHELGGRVVWLDAPAKMRYERIRSKDRGRTAEDNITFDEFLAHEAIELQSSGDMEALDMNEVKNKSDVFVFNDADGLDTLASRVLPLLRE